MCKVKVDLTCAKALREYPCDLRIVVVWDEANQREIALLTNHIAFGATTVSAIYKNRWQIELVFKAIKQNLKIKAFVGTSENALLTQIRTALIAILLLKFMKFRATYGWSLSNLVAFLRWNLFSYRNLWAWLEKPFDTPPQPLRSVQYSLFGPILGQQISPHPVPKPDRP